MRSFLRDHWKAVAAIVLLVVLAIFTLSPGAATPAPTLATRLRTHVAALAPEAGAGTTPRQLQQAARYIEATLRAQGYAIRRRDDAAGRRPLRNIEAALANLAPHARPARIFIVGTHVGAADADPAGKGSGAAAVLELARLLKDLRPSLGTEIRFVFFFDTAPAWSGGQDFIAFVGTQASSRPVQQALAAFQGSPAAPAHGLAIPAYVQGVTLSGHAASHGRGAPAVMVTNTAFGRYPYYEAAPDDDDDPPGQPAQPDQADYTAIARVVRGLARTLAALAAGQQG